MLARTLWLSTLLLPALAHAGPMLRDDADLKDALHDILSHGNLFDVAYVSERLGLGLHVAPRDSDGRHFDVVATTTPPVIYGNPRYYLWLDPEHRTSMADITVTPRVCPSLREWARAWGLQLASSPVIDGDGFYTSLQWPGSEGVSLGMIEGGNACAITLQQAFKRLLPAPVAPPPVPIAPEHMARQIGDLLETGDLRDYRRIARILGAEFVFDAGSLRHRLMISGSASLAHPIRGLTPAFFYYESSDGGWYQKANPFTGPSGPLHPGERQAALSVTVDVGTVCVSQDQLDVALRERPSVQVAAAGPDNNPVYYVDSGRAGGNLISLRAYYDRGCATELHFSQRTDFPRGVGAPLVLKLSDSLDPRTRALTPDARHQVEFLAARLRWPNQLGGVEVKIVPGRTASAGIDSDLAALERRIRQELDDAGIPLNRQPEPDFGACPVDDEDGPLGPAVCIDAWLKAP